MILFIHPPVVKPCEPPAGIGKLCGVLRREGIPVSVLDANLEGLLGLLENSAAAETHPEDRWTARARRSCSRHLDTLRDLPSCRRPSRYRRAVSDLNRLLDRAVVNGAARPGLGNFRHPGLSPVRSGDLIHAAETPEENPFYPWFVKRIEGCLEREAPSFVGFSLNYLSQALTTFAMIGFLKRTCPGLTLILGGGLVTSWLSRPGWQNPFNGLVDHVIAGPGEGPLLDLLRPMPVSSTERKYKIGVGAPSGAHMKSSEEILVLPEKFPIGEAEASPTHLNTSPPHTHDPPDYDGLPLHDYLSPGTILPYSASRGCWWRKCVFCPERAEMNPYVPVSPGRVTSDLAALREKTSPVLIHLLDNAVSPALLEAMAKNPPGAPWYSFARITPHLTDPDFCRSLKRSGCALLKLGLESGDQDVLDQLEKGIHLGEASRALRTLREAGIPAYVYLLFGTPAEGGESARRTLDFVVKHGDCIDFLNVAVFNLPVFAASSLKLETRDFYEGDLSLYTDFSHPRGWDRQQVRTFLDREFRRHPAIAPILRRDPPVFTSNHAPFFTKDFCSLR